MVKSQKIKRIVLVDYSSRPKQRAHVRKYKSGKIKRVNPGIKKRQQMSLGIPKQTKVFPLKYPREKNNQSISESEEKSIEKNIELSKEFKMAPHLTARQLRFAKSRGMFDEYNEPDLDFSFERGRNKFRETSR